MVKLLIGGSPCTFWSIAQKNGREVTAEGLGWELFKNYLLKNQRKPQGTATQQIRPTHLLTQICQPVKNVTKRKAEKKPPGKEMSLTMMSSTFFWNCETRGTN